MSMEWIRAHYGVPAKRGARVRYTPCEGSTDKSAEGVITAVCGPHLRVRLDGERRSRIFHPTWQLQYLDGGLP
jgi:hypothetical protein